ncbi:MAG: tetratricopeptide repeat protein [Deltaproteobacteria bacterium]|nr:tetratricopeptide repeat protein [Deltaproteobacteria bacterium]
MSYPAREVARMLGLSVGQVRAWVRAGFLEPERGPKNELRFTFSDLVLMRTAKDLLAARIPPRRVKTALSKLRLRLPEGRTLRTLRIVAEGEEIVVGQDAARFRADDGQLLLDFDTSDLARKAAPVVRAVSRARAELSAASAHDWYERGCDLEEADPEEARNAYRRALELDPSHVDAHVNLGRLLHEAGDPQAAVAHYRLAMQSRPDDPTAAFNLGVALEDLHEHEAALLAYANALASDPSLADAHFNVARIHEQRGQKAQAIRHLRDYKNLTRGSRT